MDAHAGAAAGLEAQLDDAAGIGMRLEHLFVIHFDIVGRAGL